MLMPEVNIHPVEDSESEVNDKDNLIESKKNLRKTNKKWERQKKGEGKKRLWSSNGANVPYQMKSNRQI